MHTQNTLHLSDSLFSAAKRIIGWAPSHLPDSEVVEALVDAGIFEYPAQKLVEMRAFFKEQSSCFFD